MPKRIKKGNNHWRKT